MVDVAEHGFFELVRILIDQFAWHQNEPFFHIAASQFETLQKQPGQFTGVGNIGFCIQSIAFLEFYACFSGIGDDDVRSFNGCKIQECIKILVGIDGHLDTLVDVVLLMRLSVFHAFQEMGVVAVLCFQHIGEAGS